MNERSSKLDNALVERAVPTGSMRYFAWLYTPAHYRDVLAALFLIEAELHDSARAPHDVAHVRLQWWREEIERLISDQAQHPATRVLQSQNSAKIDFDRLQSIVTAAAQELANSTYETDAELDSYFKSGSGALFMLAAQCLSATPPSPAQLDTAQSLGAFVRHTEVTRDLRQDVHHGRLYLPLGRLDETHIDYETLQSAEWPAPFRHWLKLRCEQQLNSYDELKRSLLTSESSSLRPLLVLGELHARILQKIARNPAQAAQQRIELGALEKPWAAWRAARAAR